MTKTQKRQPSSSSLNSQSTESSVREGGRNSSLLSVKQWSLYILGLAIIISSSLYSLYLTILLFIVLNTTFAFFFYKLNDPKSRARLIKKLKFWWQFRKLQKQAKSYNQLQVFLGKYFLKLPMVPNEDEVKSYLDISNHYGDKWPYMHPVKNTRQEKVQVRGKDARCISSYSYLELGKDPRVQDYAIECAKQYSTGNHGPRMLCGNLEILEELEIRIAKFFNREHALVFSSGYLACMSVIAGIARKGDLILMDKLDHASLKAGAKLSGVQTKYFRHNDFKDAENVIKKSKFNRLILVIEGVYSMDGDIGDLPIARKLTDKYKGILILDEAHSTGAIGKTGRGAEEHYGYVAKADVICGTFTKSMASVGGFITCSKDLRDFYTFYAPGVVFSAPLSAYHAGAADKAFEILDKTPQLVEKLQYNANYLITRFKENGFDVGNSTTCVIPVIFRDTTRCLRMHNWLLQNGYFTACVMAPACPVTAPRFRICATAGMTKEDMDGIIDIFIKARAENDEDEELRELQAEL
jgi:7-keto-8-aminopelargonate synthetase-like enzyme